MPTRQVRLHLLVFLLAGAICPGAAVWAESQPEREQLRTLRDLPALESFVDGLVQAQMDAHMIPGLAIAITQGDRTVLLKGYGFAEIGSKTPIEPGRHLFRIASVSKPFAWMSLLQLAERGLVDLRADVNTYLDFAIPETFPGQPVRVHDLITHTSGFEAVNIGSSSHAQKDRIPLDAAVRKLLPERVHPPGQRTNYSNYGAALGGYIVERVSGTPYPEYLQREIFEPLGMTRTTMRQPPPEPLARDLVTGYTPRDGALVAGRYSYLNLYPDGALQTTAADMARFAIAHLNPDRHEEVLSQEGFATMHEVQFANIPQAAGMTYGFEQKIWNGIIGFGHGGDMSSFSSRLLMFPEQKVSIFIAANSDDVGAAREHIVRAFLDRYYPDAAGGQLFSSAPLENASDDIGRTYVSTRRNHSTIEKIFWPLLTGVSVDRVTDELLEVGLLGETHPYTRADTGVYVPADTTLNELAGIGPLLASKDPDSGTRAIHFSQIGSFAFEEPPLAENLKLHSVVLGAGFVMLLTGCAALIVSLVRNARELVPPGILMIAGAVAAFAFVPLIAVQLTEELVFGVPDDVRNLFWLPIAGLGLTTLSAGLFARRIVQRETAPVLAIAGAGLCYVATLVLAWQLSVWNMLGFAGIPAA